MSRAAKGGQPEGGQDGRNGLVAQSCRGRQGHGEKVEGGKTANAGRAMEAGGMEEVLARRSKNRMREKKIGCKERCRSVSGWRI